MQIHLHTNNITVARNGSKIGGLASSPATLSTQGQSVTFIYVDSTEGWINVGDATPIQGNPFVVATGGTITTCGNYKIHSFTGPGTFTVTNAGNPQGSNSVDYLVVAGGGAWWIKSRWRRWWVGTENQVLFRSYSISPLGSAVSALPVSVQGYPITVGGGGALGPTR
jgi:hypothetical protein